MSDVPPEIISDILSRLPVKSLLRFRCLSKPFCDLIDSPDFIKSHLHHSVTSNSHRSIVISGCRLCSIDFDLLDKRNLLFPGTQVVGSCNGLICLSSNDDVFVCNPSTRELRKLPDSDVEFSEYPYSLAVCENVRYGFGYDFVNDDYKVLRIVLPIFDEEAENEVKVYSLKSNSWRRIKDFPYYFSSMGSGVLVNGALHWVVSEDDSIGLFEDFKICSFDFATEEYHLVPQPPYFKIINLINVWELGGRLCVHCIDYIWVMNRYGVKDSWTKLLSFSQSVGMCQLEYRKPIAYSKDEKQVLLSQEGRRLLWYDLKLKTFKRIRISGLPKFCHAYISHGSLVKLTAGARTDVTHEESKIWEKAIKEGLGGDFLSKEFKLKL